MGILHATSWVFSIYGQRSGDTSWFKIVDGLLALGELISWVMVGVGGIGWILSRRELDNTNTP